MFEIKGKSRFIRYVPQIHPTSAVLKCKDHGKWYKRVIEYMAQDQEVVSSNPTGSSAYFCSKRMMNTRVMEVDLVG